MNATHRFAPEDLMAFVDGELAGEEAAAIAAHLENCAECAGTVAQFRATSEALARWTVPEVSAGMGEAVRAEAARGSGRRRAGGKASGRWLGRGWVVQCGLTAAAMLGVVVVVSHLRAPAPAKRQVRMAEHAETGYPAGVSSDLPRGGGVAGEAAVRSAQRLAAMSSGGEGLRQSLTAAAGGSDGATSPGPMIARSASLGIVVKQLEAARSAVDVIAARRHGYAAELTESDGGGGGGTLEVSLRVPVGELTGTVGELKTLGRVVRESQTGEEVSQRHADLVQRLKTARDTEERFRAILQQRTGSVAEVLEVEEKIAVVRGEIEEMEAEQKNLEHRVEYANVEVSMSQEYKAPLEAGGDSFGVRSHNALVAGYQNATGTLVGLVLFAEEFGPALVLWGVILGLPGWLVWRWYGRRRV